MALVTEVETMGRSETRAMPADLAAGAAGGVQVTQTGSCAKSTQANQARRPRLPWLPTDDESEMKPEDFHSQGDRPAPHKDRWEWAVGGAVSGIRQLGPLWGPLAREM